MIQLATTLKNLGVDEDSIKDLRRWDRVHMIKEMSGIAVNEGVQDAGYFQRYVRKTRPNSTAEKDDYRKNCNEIWERQMKSLSVTREEVIKHGK
ncbi:unnamed protein product [Choristocarpus tenellus]